MGVLTPDQLRQIVTEQVKAILYSVFSWEKGTVTFEVGRFRTDELIQLDVSTPQAIADGIRRLPDPRRVVRASDRPGRSSTGARCRPRPPASPGARAS